MKSFVLFIVALFINAQLFAHALWIETNPSGQAGKAHEVKIFYGEYADGKPDKIAQWYSDVKEFSLWLVTPDNQKIKLTATAGEDHYKAEFTPAANGVYFLQISHDAKDLGKTTKYQFNTSASVKVGKSSDENISANLNALKFFVRGNQLQQPVLVHGLFNGLPSDKMTVTVVSPKGWTKTITGNSEGIAAFTPEWRGKYMIEISRTDDEKGDHYGKSYDRVWRCATYFLEVK